MPCMYNGQPVKGNKGACPYGSTWQDNVVAETAQETSPDLVDRQGYMSEEDYANMQEWEGGGLQNIGDWFTPGGAVKAGLGIASLPFIKGGYNILKKKATDPNNLKKLQNLKRKLFQRFDQPVRPKYPIMNKAQEAAWRKANPGKWLLDKWKLTGWGGAGTAGLAHLMDQMGGDAKTTNPLYPDGFMSTEEQYQQTAGGKPPPPEPNAMQRLGANMKDPKWWHESISGLPSDTRLMRLGQLMEYYGKTPKQRADSTAPAELWAENEVAHGKNVAAASGSDSTFLAKFNSEDQDLAIRKSVRDRLGFSDWIPLNQASEEELEQTVARVKGLIQEYVKKGMNWSDALTLSMSYVTKE